MRVREKGGGGGGGGWTARPTFFEGIKEGGEKEVHPARIELAPRESFEGFDHGSARGENCGNLSFYHYTTGAKSRILGYVACLNRIVLGELVQRGEEDEEDDLGPPWLQGSPFFGLPRAPCPSSGCSIRCMLTQHYSPLFLVPNFYSHLDRIRAR